MSKPISRVTFMIKPRSEVSGGFDAHEMLANGAGELGWQAEYADIDSLRLEHGEVRWQSDGRWRGVGDTDLIWLTSLGERATFLDKMQLLQMVAAGVPVVNAPAAVVFRHNKYRLADFADGGLRTPETYASHDADWLYEQARRGGGRWVVKPPAGSRGEGVFVLDADAPDERERLAGDGYLILQRWMPEVQQGEKRVLLAGGEVVGQYLRTATGGSLTNLARGGRATMCDLSQAEQSAMRRLAERLKTQGVMFAGVDLCWPWLIEVNILSPGGLATIKDLTGVDLSATVFAAVTDTVCYKKSGP